jgi:hypothetical protein
VSVAVSNARLGATAVEAVNRSGHFRSPILRDYIGGGWSESKRRLGKASNTRTGIASAPILQP